MSDIWEVFDGPDGTFDLVGPIVVYSAPVDEVIEVLEHEVQGEDEIICRGLTIMVDGHPDAAIDEVRREIG